MRSLEHEGVTTLFGYPGGAIMPVYDALYGYKDKLNHVLVRHEQGATHAAQGYARVSGKVGVALVTSGPGATNTITGIADAMMDSTPIVVIAGQVGASLLGSDAFQECDLVGVTQPISKWAYQIRRPEDVAWAVSRAFYIAKSGRPGPVVLDFAKNAQVGLVDYEPQGTDFIRSYVPVPKTDPWAIRQAAALINNAKRPFILVGQGAEPVHEVHVALEELRVVERQICCGDGYTPFECAGLRFAVAVYDFEEGSHSLRVVAQEHHLLSLFDVEAHVVEEHCAVVVHGLQSFHFQNLVARLALHLEYDSRIFA